MRYPIHHLFLSLLMLFVFTFQVVAQQQSEQEHQHNHSIYQQIERDYEKGQLNIDQKVLLKFYATHNLQKLPSVYQQEDKSPLKCGTPALLDFQRNRSELSRSTVSEIESVMDPQISASETLTSPSGRFEIHYETAGSHAVPAEDSDDDGIPDYVEQTAEAADSSYRHMVQNLGYTDPIPEGGTYEIEILNLEVIYGETRSFGNSTYIRIENDFSEGFPPNDHPEDHIGAVNATVAHEFKHAIQYAATSWSGETSSWLEMDATLMEEVVYDEVNDYYNYLQSEESIFNNPQQSFYPGSYFHVSWALFFEEKYGSDFWPQVWEIIKQDPRGTTMIGALTQQLDGTEAYRRAYAESQLWHYASGQNSAPNFGFVESENYPTPDVNISEELFTENFAIPRPSPRPAINSFSARYYEIPVNETVQGDILVDITSSGMQKELGLIAYYQDGSVATSTSLIAMNESSFKMPNLNWSNIEKLGLILANSDPFSSDDEDNQTIVGVGPDNPETVELSHNYPNPFNPQTRIRFTVDQRSPVELKIYDSAGRLVTTLVDEELSPGLYEPVFDGSGLASGIYFYQLITDGQTQTQQMTLIK